MLEKLNIFLELLQKWNRAYNLVGTDDRAVLMTHHIQDSLSVLPFLKGKKILDVGSGAGFPGIPLAIAEPSREFVLLDSNGKKIRFLTEVKRVLDLKNVSLVEKRVEDYQTDFCFDVILSRALSSLQKFFERSEHLLCKEGIFLAMKGTYPLEELAEVSEKFIVKEVKSLKVEGLEGQRHLVIGERNRN